MAQALVHDPQLIVLDEPLNGVDPVGRVELVQLFKSLAAEGKAVLVSSHLLDEMDRLADEILFICHGRILASGTLSEIRDLLDDHPLQIRVTSDRARELAGELVQKDWLQGVEVTGPEDLQLQVEHSKQFFEEFNQLVVAGGYRIERLQISDASTEAVFSYLMGANRGLL